QVEQWQRQAQEAMQAQPDRKDAIAAQLHEMITTLATSTWANQAQEAVDAGIPRQQVLDQDKGMLQEHGLAVSPESNFDEWFKQGRGPQFKNVKAGSDSTADPSFDVEYQANKFEDETPEEYFDRVERQGKQAAKDTGVYAEQKA